MHLYLGIVGFTVFDFQHGNSLFVRILSDVCACDYELNSM